MLAVIIQRNGPTTSLSSIQGGPLGLSGLAGLIVLTLAREDKCPMYMLLSAADIYVLSLDGHYSKYIASPINLIHFISYFCRFLFSRCQFSFGYEMR